jgi:hypothetical protein
MKELAGRFDDSVSVRVFYLSGSEESMRQTVLLEKGLDTLFAYTQGRILIPSADWADAARYAGVKPETVTEALDDGTAIKLLEKHKPPAKLLEEYKKKKYPLLIAENNIYPGKPNLAGWASFVNKFLPKEKRAALVAGAAEEKKTIFTVVQDSASVSGRMDKRIVDYLKQYGMDLQLNTLNADDPVAKGLVEEYGTGKLPLYLLDKNVEENAIFAKLSGEGMVRRKNDLYLLEIKGANVSFYDRKKIPRELRIFVMPECPAGLAAERAVFNADGEGRLPAGISVKLNYIVRSSTSSAGPFISLHGRSEWEEAARQKIVEKYFPGKLRAYLAERNSLPDSSLWDVIARNAGMDPAFMNEKFNEGKELLAGDAALVSELGISASPTFLWENTQLVVGLKALSEIRGLSSLPADNPDTCED